MKAALIATFLLAVSSVFAQSREVEPYTLHPIIPGVIHIEDANHQIDANLMQIFGGHYLSPCNNALHNKRGIAD
ncbi:hypothetical protein VDG1235_2059 [Verrucomicrobiia bacterium DG1235]|nr:hypothetical protein VDG1235_2059 [Verrucomicrobiae bacterium DG1235]